METTRIRLAEPQWDMKALATWLLGNPRLTQGELVQRFEGQWSAFHNREWGVMVNSGSSANLIALAALKHSGYLHNTTIVLPQYAWSTTVAPAIQLGFDIVLCPVDADNWGMDVTHLESIMKNYHPAVVMPVHVLGIPCDISTIELMCRKYGAWLIEDNCPSSGSSIGSILTGSWGDLATSSFYAGHPRTTIEGGMIIGDDYELRDLMLMLRSHGWMKDIPESRHEYWRQHFNWCSSKYNTMDGQRNHFDEVFTFNLPSYNTRATEIMGFMGLEQMRTIEDMIEHRNNLHTLYKSALEGTTVSVQNNDDAEVQVPISIGASCKDHRQRARIASALTENGIETRPVCGGSMKHQPMVRNHMKDSDTRCVVVPDTASDRLDSTTFMLPVHHNLTEEDVEVVCTVVKEALTEP
jgi:CDP-4-dehydro-6-deoxyglucose reductase, E1